MARINPNHSQHHCQSQTLSALTLNAQRSTLYALTP